MRLLAKAILAAPLLAMLAACASSPPIPRKVINRALAQAPGAAQPSLIVAKELEFARTAQEDGQWSAFRAFAAPGAVMHTAGGPINALTFLAGVKDPAVAITWNTDTVWMSCDSLLAVAQGRFKDPESKVGTFITVWERQSDLDYRWTYDVAVLDNPQPPVRDTSAAVGGDEIVVTAIDSIKGLVADCPNLRADKPATPAFLVPDGARHGFKLSPDGTLRWRWEHTAGADRRFVAEYLTGGRWEVVVDQPLGPAASE